MIEKRRHSRVLVHELHAEICIIDQEKMHKSVYQGAVLDMSYSGVKIKLLTAMLNVSPRSKISIVLTHANLSTPMTIKGMIRHTSENREFGIAFNESIQERKFDELVFECVKNFPIKSNLTE